MKAIEYMTEITSDGRIDLSPDTLRRLVDNRRTSVRILILFDDMPRAASRPRFAGRWQTAADDDRAFAISIRVWRALRVTDKADVG